MNTNPYSTPAAIAPSGPPPISTAAVSAAVVRQLAATKPWVRFMAVITFIGAGFMLLAAAGMLLVGVVGGLTGPAVMAGSSMRNPFTGAMGFGLAALYAVLSIVYIFPGMKLWKYANSIALLIQSGSNDHLVEALNQQRSFWKFVGVMVCSMLILYVLIIIAVAVIAGIAAVTHH